MVVATVVALVTPRGMAADPAGADDAVAAQVEAGRRIYTSSCARCHGIRLAANGIGFDLRTFPSDDRVRFDRSVSQGLRAMPAWAGVLKPDDFDAIWAYIGAVNGWPTAVPSN